MKEMKTRNISEEISFRDFYIPMTAITSDRFTVGTFSRLKRICYITKAVRTEIFKFCFKDTARQNSRKVFNSRSLKYFLLFFAIILFVFAVSTDSRADNINNKLPSVSAYKKANSKTDKKSNKSSLISKDSIKDFSIYHELARPFGLGFLTAIYITFMSVVTISILALIAIFCNRK